MNTELGGLPTQALENIISQRKEHLTRLYNSAVKLGKQLGEYDGSAKKDLPLTCEEWTLENFHNFDIRVTWWKAYITGVIGSSPNLCLVHPKATFEASTTIHFWYNGRYMGYIDKNHSTGKIEVDDHYKKGAWENKLLDIMRNFGKNA